jgi:hypothetical protein
VPDEAIKELEAFITGTVVRASAERSIRALGDAA